MRLTTEQWAWYGLIAVTCIVGAIVAYLFVSAGFYSLLGGFQR
jgi:uncharacterized membrane protein